MMGMNFEGCAHNMGTPLRDAVDRAWPEAVLAELVVDPVHIAARSSVRVELREDAGGVSEAVLRYYAPVRTVAVHRQREARVRRRLSAAGNERPDVVPDEVLVFEKLGTRANWRLGHDALVA
jgi:hypothetical protein